jgi:plastocyanin
MLAAALSAALTAALSGATAGAATPKLTGTVTDAARIALMKGGTMVTRLKPGTYTIAVRDSTDEHNFHLTGPGVNKETAVGAAGTVTWRVTLKKGKYTYVCDPHKSFMRGSFSVS